MLSDNGGNVAITGRDKSKLEKVANEISAFPIHADAAKEDDVNKTYELFLHEFGKLDCLINNAGIGGGWFSPNFVDLREGDALSLPLENETIDVAAQNCLFNIFHDEELEIALTKWKIGSI